jgi:hypothetical protein
MVKNFFSRFLVAVSLAIPSSSYALELNSLAGNELPAVSAVPAPSAPAKVSSRGCRPFLMSLSVGGVNETVVIERACTAENDQVWVLQVELRGKTGIAAKVSSDKYPDQKAAIEKRIKNMAVEGISQADADFIVMKTGPALELAAKSAPAEKEKILAEAAEALKNQLARP